MDKFGIRHTSYAFFLMQISDLGQSVLIYDLGMGIPYMQDGVAQD